MQFLLHSVLAHVRGVCARLLHVGLRLPTVSDCLLPVAGGDSCDTRTEVTVERVLRLCSAVARRLSRTLWRCVHDLTPGPGQRGLDTVRMGNTVSVLSEIGALVGRNPVAFTGGAGLAAGASKLPVLLLFFRSARRDSAGRPFTI